MATNGLNEEMAINVMEITGATHEEAAFLLDSFQGNVENAIAYYFDHLQHVETKGGGGSGGSGGKDGSRGTAASAAHGTTAKKERDPANYDPLSENSVRDNDVPLSIMGGDLVDLATYSAAKPTQLNANYMSLVDPDPNRPRSQLPLSFEAMLAWPSHGKTKVKVELLPTHTIGNLKQCIYNMTGVPVVVQRINYLGTNFLKDDNNLELSQAGFTRAGTTYRVAVMFAPRDEEGPVKFVDPEKGKDVLVLRQGEWSVSSSMTEARRAVAKILKLDPSKVMFVCHGITLKDATTFGQYGIHQGSVISVFRQEN